MLFDNRELELINKKQENVEEILNEVKNKEYNTNNLKEYKVCPICKTVMAKMGAANGGVQIDVCSVCGAKFLDHGELEKINAAANEKFEDSPQNKIIYNNLLQESSEEALGKLGLFIQNHTGTYKSEARQSVENFFRKYV